MKRIAILTGLIAAALVVPAQAQQKNRMYKCVDPAGKVYYSDKMNPECGKGSELNRQGVVMPKKEVAKPAQPAKTDPVLPKSEKDTQRRDRALLATYASEQEIDAARDRSLAPLLQGTKAIEAKLDKGSQRLSELKKQAEALAAQKKPLPAPLLEDVEAAQKETSGLDADLAQRKALMESIRARYEADKQRFRELKGKGQ